MTQAGPSPPRAALASLMRIVMTLVIGDGDDDDCIIIVMMNRTREDALSLLFLLCQGCLKLTTPVHLLHCHQCHY